MIRESLNSVAKVSVLSERTRDCPRRARGRRRKKGPCFPCRAVSLRVRGRQTRCAGWRAAAPETERHPPPSSDPSSRKRCAALGSAETRRESPEPTGGRARASHTDRPGRRRFLELPSPLPWGGCRPALRPAAAAWWVGLGPVQPQQESVVLTPARSCRPSGCRV